ncbi:MAG TPA: DUF1559 domain-containing protein [Gemmata sp.]|nr:DUF1559 domain-containing protein [Gemmata sp.]
MHRWLFASVVLATLASPAAGQPVPDDPGLKAVPTDAFAFVSVKVSKLWDNPAAKQLRDWAATQRPGELDSILGVHPAEIDRVTAFVASWDRDAGGAPVVIVTTRKQYNEAKVLKALASGIRGVEPRVRGRVVELRESEFRWLLFADERTLIFLQKDLDDKALGGELLARLVSRKADGPLAAALAAAQAHDVVMGLDVRGVEPLTDFDKNRDLVAYRALLQARTAVLTADLDKTAKGRLVLTFPDAAAAKRAAPVLEDGIKLLLFALGEEVARPRADRIDFHATSWMLKVLKAAAVSVDGATVVATADVPFADDLAKLVAALPKSLRDAAIDTTVSNNLKQLALAFHNYESAFGQFPSDVAPGANAPLAWSWRVQILPFIEQDNLYKRLDFTKQWVAPENLRVLESVAMPKVFEHPGRPAPKGHTYFRVFSLPKGAKGTDQPFFREGFPGPKIAAITDGTSNTLMIVEAGEAVPWYQPDVLAYDGKLPLPQLGAKGVDAFHAALADGSVRKFRPSKLGEKTLRALITTSGGEIFPDLGK